MRLPHPCLTRLHILTRGRTDDDGQCVRRGAVPDDEANLRRSAAWLRRVRRLRGRRFSRGQLRGKTIDRVTRLSQVASRSVVRLLAVSPLQDLQVQGLSERKSPLARRSANRDS